MKFFKFFNLRFFDDVQTNTEDGASGEQHVEGNEGGSDLSDVTPGKDPEPDPEELVNVDPFASFNEKSPFLFAGRSEDDEGTPNEDGDDPAKNDAEGNDAGDKGEGQTPAQPKPYRVLKYRGQEVPVMSEEDLIKLASQGIDYTQKTQQIAPYRSLIERVERNPILAQRIVEVIQQADQGNLLTPNQGQQPPQPQNLSRDAEPEQREDETWDEYIERRDQWKSGKPGSGDPQGTLDNQPMTKERIAHEIEAVLAERERQERVMTLVGIAKQDEHHEEVVQALLSLPKSVQAEMNTDERAFQVMYDVMREQLKYGKYFLPLTQKIQGVAPATGNPNQQQNPAGKTQQQQSVSIKGTPQAKVPFTENGRGGTKPGASQSNKKGIWDMSPEEFRKLQGTGAILE